MLLNREKQGGEQYFQRAQREVQGLANPFQSVQLAMGTNQTIFFSSGLQGWILSHGS